MSQEENAHEIVASQAGSASSDYFDDDPDFLAALDQALFPGEINQQPASSIKAVYSEENSPDLPPPPRSGLKRPRCPELDEQECPQLHVFAVDRNPEEPSYLSSEIYGASRYGGLGEYMIHKRAKLQIQNSELDTNGLLAKDSIFAGLHIYINGWTEPSVQELRQLIVRHGGTYHAYLDRKSLVTHIITCSLTPAKIREFKHMKVAKPQWLLESVATGMLLPWKDFAFQPGERSEGFQGKRLGQKSLFNNFISQPSKQITINKQTGNFQSQDERTTDADTGYAISQLIPVDHSAVQNTANVQLLAPRRSSESLLSKSTSPHRPRYATNSTTPVEVVGLTGYTSANSNTAAERVMVDPLWRTTHTSIAPGFIEGYYRNSRLHYLSMWKAELKSLLAGALDREGNGSWADHLAPSITESVAEDIAVRKVVYENLDRKKWRVESTEDPTMKGTKLASGGKRKEKAVGTGHDTVLMHCDFDCFFVSAGLIDRPHLRGKPVVVCHSQGEQGRQTSTSEIASASYEARGFGVRNGMSLQQARKLCPDIITIPYEFERYKQLSLQFYAILIVHADDLQAVSVDEALVDVTSSVRRIESMMAQGQEPSASSSGSPASRFAEAIRTQVKSVTGCEVSIGIAHNIMLARLASRRAKPAGSFHLKPGDVPEIIATLDISDLHGFGSSAHQKAQEKFGATSLRELSKKSKAQLCEVLGKSTGETLYKAIRGIDERELESDKPRKSVSCDINYGIRFDNNEQVEAFIYQLAEEVARRLDQVDMRGRLLILKVMKRDPTASVEAPKFMGHGICDTFTKQIQLVTPGGWPTSDQKIIGEHAWRLLKSFGFDPTELRGISIQIQKLEKNTEVTDTEHGQALLPFKPIEKPKNSVKGKGKDVAVDMPDLAIQPPSQDSDIIEISGPHAVTSAAFDLPRLSQVDMSVYEALPEDVRQELAAEYQRRSVPLSGPPMPSSRNESPSITTTLRKRRATVNAPNIKRITQQLAPKSGPGPSSTKSNLFTKRCEPVPLKVSDMELLRLEIDPDVFKRLPPDVQREQVMLAGQRKAPGGSGLVFGGKRKILRPARLARRIRSPGFIHPPPPPPKAKYLNPPVLRQQGESKGSKLYFTEADDIQRVVEAWVEGFKDRPPNHKDIELFAKYLIKCADSAYSTDCGLDKVIAVVKWWLVLLRRFFALWEDAPEEPSTSDLGPDEVNMPEMVGKAWWRAFREVKSQIDSVVRKKFGGGNLSLK